MTSIHSAYFDNSHTFEQENGFKFAVAFSAFDDETEPILDKSYGQLIINSYEWGINSNGNAYVHYTPLDQHTCTEKELGL